MPTAYEENDRPMNQSTNTQTNGTGPDRVGMVGSGRDGRSPRRPPGGTRRADFPHRAPQDRLAARSETRPTPASGEVEEVETTVWRAGSASRWYVGHAGCGASAPSPRVFGPAVALRRAW